MKRAIETVIAGHSALNLRNKLFAKKMVARVRPAHDGLDNVIPRE